MSIYQVFSNKIYNNYLQRRFGINTCCNSKVSLQELNNDLCIAEYYKRLDACSKKVYCSTNSSDDIKESLYIAIEVGTPQALEYNILAGDTKFTHPLIKDRNIQVFRNNIVLTPFNRGDGSLYYIKEKVSDTLTYSYPLQDGEIIQINTV